METEKLGIKIEAPVRIGIRPPEVSHISGWYYFFLVASVIVLGIACFILSSEIFNLSLSNQIYKLLVQGFEWLRATRINF